MNSEEQLKQVTPLSTISLESNSVQGDEVAATLNTKRPNRSLYAWTLLIAMMMILLALFGLVLVAACSNRFQHAEDALVEMDSMIMTQSGENSLSAPQEKLIEWLKQAHNTTEIDVVGGARNLSVIGVVFPQNIDSLLPFNAIMSINSGTYFPRRQYIALANERGYKWDMTSFGYEDLVSSKGCLSANETLPFFKLDSVVRSANWTSADDDNVDVVFNGITYTVSTDDSDDDDILSEKCWLIESEDGKVGFRVCAASAGNQFSQADYEVLFNATTECPQLTPNAPRMRSTSSVPLPLRKWYASYGRGYGVYDREVT